MGIPTDPTDDFGDDCASCFNAGKTPSAIWLLVAGIEIGPGWASPQFEPPPNGIWKLPQVTPCTFGAQIANYTFALTLSAGVPAKAQLSIGQTVEPWTIFMHTGADECEHFFTNEDPFGDKWLGGNAQVLFNIVDGVYSLNTTLALFGMENFADLFAHPNVMPAETVMHRFASHKDVINIKIKQEY